MASKDFHDRPYDAGTLAKLRIFELYAQEWIPVFVSPTAPKFKEVHIFDFFCGPGTDSEGAHGSPLRILNQLRRYHEKGMAGWNKVRTVVHFFDRDPRKIELLNFTIKSAEWNIPGVQIDCRTLTFQDALAEYRTLLTDFRVAKLLVIDQCGVDEVSDEVFKKLIGFPTTDFIFFLSSSTLPRFRDHSAIKQKIEKPEDSYDVHRAAVDYYRKLVPATNRVFLGSFSIRKRSNIYGLIFGSHHPLGIHKFPHVAWKADEIAGEANFDIERTGLQPGERYLFENMRPKKIDQFEAELEHLLKSGKIKSELGVARFCIETGMTCQHSVPVLKKLKAEGIIETEFDVPNIRKLNTPRLIRRT